MKCELDYPHAAVWCAACYEAEREAQERRKNTEQLRDLVRVGHDIVNELRAMKAEAPKVETPKMLTPKDSVGGTDESSPRFTPVVIDHD